MFLLVCLIDASFIIGLAQPASPSPARCCRSWSKSRG
jgi:hypothetical protein